jgi:hypothetical protein
MGPDELKKILTENGQDPLGGTIWARQALIGVALDARAFFHEEGTLDDDGWESYCDDIVEGWPEL